MIRRDPDFHDDVERLATALRASVSSGILDLSKLGGERGTSPAPRETKERRGPGMASGLIVGGTLAALVAALVMWSPWRATPSTTNADAAITDTTTAGTAVPPSAASEQTSTTTPPPPQPQAQSSTTTPPTQASAPHFTVPDTAALQRRSLEASLRAALIGYKWYGGYTSGRPNDGTGIQGFWDFSADGTICHSIYVGSTCGRWSISGSLLSIHLGSDVLNLEMTTDGAETSAPETRRVVIQREPSMPTSSR